MNKQITLKAKATQSVRHGCRSGTAGAAVLMETMLPGSQIRETTSRYVTAHLRTL